MQEDKDLFHAYRVLELSKDLSVEEREGEDSHASSSIVKKHPNVQPILTASASHTVASMWPECEAVDTPVTSVLEAPV